MFTLFAQTGVSESVRNSVGVMPFVVAIVAIAGGILAGIVSTVMTNWRKRKEHEDLAVLKQQMLDRGMTADEIVRIAEAGRRKPDPKSEDKA